MFGRIELALDRCELARIAIASDQIDAGICFAVAAGPLLPQPHILKLAAVERIGLQVRLDQSFEEEPLLSGVASEPCILLENTTNGCGRASGHRGI